MDPTIPNGVFIHRNIHPLVRLSHSYILVYVVHERTQHSRGIDKRIGRIEVEASKKRLAYHGRLPPIDRTT